MVPLTAGSYWKMGSSPPPPTRAPLLYHHPVKVVVVVVVVIVVKCRSLPGQLRTFTLDLP